MVELNSKRKQIKLGLLVLALVGVALFIWSVRDWHQLWKIASAPDNIPIVAMLFLVPFFTWLGIRQAKQNDHLIEQLEQDPQLAKTHHRKVEPWRPGWARELHVWPYLVRIEFLAAVIVTVILFVWSITLNAPLEEPANPNLTMNPSKAPWYFLGLQEMLVYFDPWIAGVVMPSIIMIGLMAFPYVDSNPFGNGYYTIKERKFAYILFQLGFLELWVTLIVLGTLLRGPNWNFFGPFEFWDIHKLAALTNVNLSEYIWVRGLRTALPTNPLVREIGGILLVLFYVFVLPVLLAKGLLKAYVAKLGAPRYYVSVLLFLMMLSLPLKMLARWLFNLKYIVAIPEFFFNI